MVRVNRHPLLDHAWGLLNDFRRDWPHNELPDLHWEVNPQTFYELVLEACACEGIEPISWDTIANHRYDAANLFGVKLEQNQAIPAGQIIIVRPLEVQRIFDRWTDEFFTINDPMYSRLEQGWNYLRHRMARRIAAAMSVPQEVNTRVPTHPQTEAIEEEFFSADAQVMRFDKKTGPDPFARRDDE